MCPSRLIRVASKAALTVLPYGFEDGQDGKSGMRCDDGGTDRRLIGGGALDEVLRPHPRPSFRGPPAA